MVAIRIGISGALGILVTLSLVILMYKLIDSGVKELDEKEGIKIPDFLHVERETTTNAKKTEVKKPDDPEPPPPDIPQDQIDIEVPDSAVNISAPVVAVNPNAGLGNFARDSDFIPVYIPQPQYPRRAQERGTMGFAIVAFTITESGTIENVVPVEGYCSSKNPNDPEAQLRPCSIFNSASSRAALKLKYKPKIVDGKAVRVEGVQHKFTFIMEDS